VETQKFSSGKVSRKILPETINLLTMSNKTSPTSVLPVNLRKFIIIFITCLAGVNIYCMLDLFLYKGLEFKHYAFMGFPVIVAALYWSLWPKRIN